ncbi:glycoside hydrolase domain-containing protein [Lentisphaerota bacterium WC36G]|nr:DUF6067 family protein [Lentisphaerae bacterium WC36]
MKKFLTYTMLASALVPSFLATESYAFQTKTKHPLIEAFQETSYSEGNLFKGAKVSATSTWKNKKVHMINDGKNTKANNHWASLTLPAAATLQLKNAKELGAIKMWTFWEDGRVYQFKIEGSVDGKNWFTLTDQTKNTKKSTKKGFVFEFAPKKVKYVKVTFTNNSKGNNSGGHIVEIEGYEKYEKINDELKGSFISLEKRYHRDIIPAERQNSIELSGWKNEHVFAKFALWNDAATNQLKIEVEPAKSQKESTIKWINTHFITYTRGENSNKSHADVLSNAKEFNMVASSVRPVWVDVKVPRDAKAGKYSWKLIAKAAGGIKKELTVNLTVKDMDIPSLKESNFHLDLWQNPFAVARLHRVELWSDMHFDLMKKYYTFLGDLGQKVTTISLIDEPWRGQTYDSFYEMIKWTKKKDGSWEYDFTIFDRYVAMAEEAGIGNQINCYTMVPWGNKFAYYDEASGEKKYLHAEAGTEKYKQHWRPFLTAFVDHLKTTKRLYKTAIAMDERPQHIMDKLIPFMAKEYPELKIASAINYYSDKIEDFYDICPIVYHAESVTDEVIAKRNARGLVTTFYVCVGPRRPNTFVTSPPMESVWQGMYAARRHMTGFLRWAYNSWPIAPEIDSMHTSYPSGDCFMVYPLENGKVRSAMRTELMRDGFEDYLKIAELRRLAAKCNNPKVKTAAQELEDALEKIKPAPIQKFKEKAKDQVALVREKIAKLSDLIAK